MDLPDFGSQPDIARQIHWLQSLLDSPSDLVLLLDIDGTIHYANRTFIHLAERKPSEVIGHNLAEVLPPLVCKRRMDQIQQVVRTQQALRFEDFGVKDWYDSTIFPIFGPNGTIEKVAAVARNVTHRKMMETELRESFSTIQALLNAPTDIVLLLETDGRIVLANSTFLQLVGKTLAELIGSMVWNYVPRNVLVSRKNYFHQVIKTKQPVRFEDRGIADYLDIVLYPILDLGGEVHRVAVIARIITHIKATEEALRQSREELRLAGEELTNRVMARTVELDLAVQQAEALARIATRLNGETDLNGIGRIICDEARQITNYASSSVHLCDEGGDFLTIFAASGMHKDGLLRLSPTPRLLFEDHFSAPDSILIVPNLSEYPPRQDVDLALELDVSTMVVLPINHGGELIGALSVFAFEKAQPPNNVELKLLQALTDLGGTALAKALTLKQTIESHERLKMLSRRLVEIQEIERRNLGMELHDQVGQMLTSLALSINRIAQTASQADKPAHEQTLAEMEAADRLVRELLDQVRNLSMELRPPILDELGLLPALIAYFDKFAERNGVQIQFKHGGLKQRLNPILENAIYRMIQESLTNVVRYAQVNEAVVNLMQTGSLLVAQVRDQGIGFDIHTIGKHPNSSGLAGMRERIELCGGRLTVESEIGRGTRLTAEFSLDEIEPLFNKFETKG